MLKRQCPSYQYQEEDVEVYCEAELPSTEIVSSQQQSEHDGLLSRASSTFEFYLKIQRGGCTPFLPIEVQTEMSALS